MESWKHLDVGVFGGAAKKETFGKSATPRFDELAKTDVLYSKDYTPCVQTLRTARRLLRSNNTKRDDFNLFWSAVNLTWEYWDKLLLKNRFDKLVDDRKVCKILHETRNYKNTPDDHLSWDMHDHLSFEMLLYAIEAAHNASVDSIDVATAPSAGSNANNTMSTNATEIESMTGATEFYEAPDLSEVYTPYNKKYLDLMRFSDEMLGDFIAALGTKGLMKNTIVMIEGDHSYDRLEHDNKPVGNRLGCLFTNIVDIVDEASKVSFLLLADDFLREEDKGMVVSQLSMQSDLMATIADIFGVTSDEPLYQHGYGHSMKRCQNRPEAQREAQALASRTQDNTKLEDSEAEAVAAEARENLQERRVVLCNPFNGMTKDVRTEELKYNFHPHGAYNVFKAAIDSAEKKPLRTGFDIETMDDATRDSRYIHPPQIRST